MAASPNNALHIILVGTSIIRNTINLLEKCAAGDTHSCAMLGIDMLQAQDALKELYTASRDGCRQPPPNSPEDEKCGGILESNKIARKAADNFINNHPYLASAELNAMQEALNAGCPCIGEILLIHSDTHLGRAAAQILGDYLSQRCPAKVTTKVAQYLGSNFALGLESLKNIVINVSKEFKGPIALNLTGGFKPEGAAASIIGYTLPNIYIAYYRHEAFKDTVIIPLTPRRTAAEVLSCITSKRLNCGPGSCGDFAIALCSVKPSSYKCSCDSDCPSPLIDSSLETTLRMLQ